MSIGFISDFYLLGKRKIKKELSTFSLLFIVRKKKMQQQKLKVYNNKNNFTVLMKKNCEVENEKWQCRRVANVSTNLFATCSHKS